MSLVCLTKYFVQCLLTIYEQPNKFHSYIFDSFSYPHSRSYLFTFSSYSENSWSYFVRSVDRCQNLFICSAGNLDISFFAYIQHVLVSCINLLCMSFDCCYWWALMSDEWVSNMVVKQFSVSLVNIEAFKRKWLNIENRSKPIYC